MFQFFTVKPFACDFSSMILLAKSCKETCHNQFSFETVLRLSNTKS